MPSNVPQSEILVGQRIGQGVVTRLGLRKGTRNLRAAELLCDCGTTYVAQLGHLRAGLVKSCGCLRRETARKHVTMMVSTHRMSSHPLYQTWYNMMHRCHDSRDARYKDYGARGVQVCPEWHDVRGFVAYVERELGPRPPGMSLDRIDNNDGYRPGNIRWNTDAGQFENTDRRSRDLRNGRFASAGGVA
jgi:hypothetical protein